MSASFRILNTPQMREFSASDYAMTERMEGARAFARVRHAQRALRLKRGTAIHSRAEQVFVRHRDPADERADDADQSLIGAADEEVFQRGGAVVALFRGAVDGAVVVAGEAADRFGGEDVDIDHMWAEVGDEAHGRRDHPLVPPLLLLAIGGL